MDRPISYTGAVPLLNDFLGTNRNVMTALGYALQAILGTSTLVDGLACIPTAPASLQVQIGAGSILSLADIDATAYGNLAADTTHEIVKQGISLDPVLLTCTAPTTTGNSINYLVQVAYQDQDTGSTVLPYFNSDNPSVAFNGPNNTGTSQNTIRKGACVISLKAGASAPTGTQTTPSPDAGFTGLWVVTVANGATTIVSGNIAQASGAPFISEKLLDKISLATGDARYQRIGSGIRSTLSANTTFYYSTSGNDTTGNGTSGNPWATRQHAWDTVKNTYDLNGKTVMFQAVDGTYTDTFTPSGWMVGQFSASQVIFNGNSGSPTNVLINPSAGDGFLVSNAGFQVQNMKVQAASGNGFNAAQAGNLVIGPGITVGACLGARFLMSAPGALINLNNSYSASGNAANEWLVQSVGAALYVAPGITVTLTGTPAYSTAFAEATLGGLIYLQTTVPAFSGSATGARYMAGLNGLIDTQGSSATYLPGNSAGSTATGGQYV